MKLREDVLLLRWDYYIIPLSRKEKIGFCVQGDNLTSGRIKTPYTCAQMGRKSMVDINLQIWLTDFHNRKMNCFSFVNCIESEREKGLLVL